MNIQVRMEFSLTDSFWTAPLFDRPSATIGRSSSSHCVKLSAGSVYWEVGTLNSFILIHYRADNMRFNPHPSAFFAATPRPITRGDLQDICTSGGLVKVAMNEKLTYNSSNWPGGTGDLSWAHFPILRLGPRVGQDNILIDWQGLQAGDELTFATKTDPLPGLGAKTGLKPTIPPS